MMERVQHKNKTSHMKVFSLGKWQHIHKISLWKSPSKKTLQPYSPAQIECLYSPEMLQCYLTFQHRDIATLTLAPLQGHLLPKTEKFPIFFLNKFMQREN